MKKNIDQYRITARIITNDGKKKTVSFPGTRETMERTMKRFFNAVEYQLVKFGETRFANSMPWERIEK